MVWNYKRKSERFTWSKENLERAADYVRFGSASVREAAQKYDIPKSTLQRYLKGNVETGKRGAFNTVFNKEMEEELVKHALKLQSLMYGLTGEGLCSFAFQFAEKNNLKHPFCQEKKRAGPDWLRQFMLRHPELSFRTPEKTSLSRITGFNRVQMTKFFDLIREAFEEHHFEPQRIFNVDETGISTVPNRTSKVIAKKGVKQVGKVTSGEKGQTTTLVCAMNAAGSFIPPVFIFARKNMNSQLLRNAPVGSVGLCSDSGWINSELFPKWLDHLIEHAKPSKEDKLLLILDNHVSHCSYDAIVRAREKGIVMITIPPHTSHKSQPLDRTFFGPLKTMYEQECNKFMVNNPGKRITQYDIAELVRDAYDRCASVEKGVKEFKCTGIYPFNPDIFDESDYSPSEVTERKMPEESPTDAADGDVGVKTCPDVPSTSPVLPVPSIANAQDPGPSGIERPTHESPDTQSSSSDESSGTKANVSIEVISPIPKVNRSEKSRKRTAGKAELLTSSPYKAKVLEKLQNKRQNASRVESTQQKKASAKGGKGQSQHAGKGKEVAKQTTLIDSEYWCIFCSEQYKEPITEDWIQCSVCGEWCHERCADLKSDSV